jgi:hypothetical protein
MRTADWLRHQNRHSRLMHQDSEIIASLAADFGIIRKGELTYRIDKVFKADRSSPRDSGFSGSSFEH